MSAQRHVDYFTSHFLHTSDNREHSFYFILGLLGHVLSLVREAFTEAVGLRTRINKSTYIYGRGVCVCVWGGVTPYVRCSTDVWPE